MNCQYPNGDQEEILVWPVWHNHICGVILHTILNCVFPICSVFLQIEGEMLQGLRLTSAPLQSIIIQKNKGWNCKTSGDEYIEMAGGIVESINYNFSMNVHSVS